MKPHHLTNVKLVLDSIFLPFSLQVAIHGYTAYGASKWALRGLAEALQMEVKPFGIYVSVSYPPDTDTPGEDCVSECVLLGVASGADSVCARVH